ncbi:uncharacterized protein LOC133174544 [Saccostrea echinata]|uniref:uncharacterized protein LOC133174544 n=1 Tax=Saccostrea echinata TaxID=191078 RepID=UPI002A7FE653|nr:uncharacterized protein LOC133174544 [Saccostrea echinata]
MSLMDVVTSYTITWLKDEAKITKSFTELADGVEDSKYSLNIFAEQGTGFVSSLQIKGLTEEDEGTFTCELMNKSSSREGKSVSISVEGMVGTAGTKVDKYESGTIFDSTTYIPSEDINRSGSDETMQQYEETTPVLLSVNETSTTIHIMNIDTKTTNKGMDIENKTDSNLSTGANLMSTANNKTEDNNLTTGANFMSTANNKTEDNNLTTRAKVVSTVGNTTNALEGENHLEDGNNAGLIAGITVTILLLIVVAIIMVLIIKRRQDINWEICFHKSKRKEYEPPQNDSFTDYQNLGYTKEMVPNHSYINNEQAVRARRAYEDANDKDFLSEYETNKSMQKKSSRKEGANGVPKTLSQDDSSESDCFRDFPDRGNDGVFQKKKNSPYETCHDITFLQNF